MNLKDIRHYKFLRRAIEFKYRFPDQSAFETFSYDPYIFRWASNTFYELKLFDYLDIKERAVLVRVYENLKKDPRLKFLDDPDSLKDQDQFKLPESFHVKIESEQAKVSAQAPQTTPAGGVAAQSTQPASGRGPAFHPPSLPSTPSVSSTRGKLPRVSFGAGNVLRNWGSQSSIFLKKNVFGKILTPTRLVTGFTTILGGIVGSGLGPIGTLAGAGAGFLAPSYVKTFGARHLGGLAHWGADSMVRLSSQTSRFSVGGFGGRSVTGKRFAIAAILLFLGVGALAAFAPLPGQQTPPAAAAPITSTVPTDCPVANGTITYKSYDADPKSGHCTPDSAEYPCQAACPTIGRRAKSIDVDTTVTGRQVTLPTINSQIVDWKFIDVVCAGSGTYPGCTAARGATGSLQVYEGMIAGTPDKWYLQFVHMEIPHSLELNKNYPSGTVAGKTDIGIVHVTIGKNIKSPKGSGSVETDCDPGWIAADSMCKK